MIGATAFTFGNDIHFAPDAYDPRSTSGQHVLAHELSHVVQQGGEARRQPIRRLGDALNLMDISHHYDTEEVDARADLVGAIAAMADGIRRSKTSKDMIEASDSEGELQRGKDWVLKVPAQSTDLLDARGLAAQKGAWERVHAQLKPMDKAAALARISGIYTRELTKAQREDVAIGEDGTLDRAALAARRVVYDNTPEQQAASTVTIAGSKLKRSATHASASADVDTADSVTHHSGNGWEIFVVGPGGDLHMASHKIGKFHHSSLLGGGTVAMAGEMKVAAGKIAVMSNKSGHYAPSVHAFVRYLKKIRSQGISLDFPIRGFGVPVGKTGEQVVNEIDASEDAGTGAVTFDTGPDRFGNPTSVDIQQSERTDVETAWQSYIADGKDPMGFVTGAPPAGLGWQTRAGGFERPVGEDIPGPTVWEEVSHEEALQALTAEFGPPKKNVRKFVAGFDMWGDPEDQEQFRWE